MLAQFQEGYLVTAQVNDLVDTAFPGVMRYNDARKMPALKCFHHLPYIYARNMLYYSATR